MVNHAKGEQSGEDLVRRKAGREPDQDHCIEYAKAARNMTDQPGHERQNIHCKNVRIPDGRGMRQAGVEHSGYERQIRDGKGNLRERGPRSRKVERVTE